MELRELVDAIQVVEVSAETRIDVIREMASTVNWGDGPTPSDQIVNAVEDREATAQTVVAEGFALPHAVIDWNGSFRIVLGRSRTGIAYGIPGTAPVHLVVLLLVGRDHRSRHLDLLAAIAELLHGEDFRRQLAEASDAVRIRGFLCERAGLIPAAQQRFPGKASSLNRTMVEHAMQLADALSAQAMLLAVDRLDSVPWDLLSHWRGTLLVVAADSSDGLSRERPKTHVFEVPHGDLSRTDRANLGLLLAASEGHLDDTSSVVCVTGPPGSMLDSVTVTKPKSHLQDIFTTRTTSRAGTICPAVILRILSLAMELANEGREGRPVGTMFVVGDSRQVLRRAQQMVLNPFHGFSRTLRNVLDPSLAETIKEFAQIDGAFIIQNDGTVLSAGTYLAPKQSPIEMPAGLGARHTTAAGITRHTRAMAVTVSQSTGTVTIFRAGGIVMTLERAAATRW